MIPAHLVAWATPARVIPDNRPRVDTVAADTHGQHAAGLDIAADWTDIADEPSQVSDRHRQADWISHARGQRFEPA